MFRAKCPRSLRQITRGRIESHIRGPLPRLAPYRRDDLARGGGVHYFVQRQLGHKDIPRQSPSARVGSGLVS